MRWPQPGWVPVKKKVREDRLPFSPTRKSNDLYAALFLMGCPVVRTRAASRGRDQRREAGMNFASVARSVSSYARRCVLPTSARLFGFDRDSFAARSNLSYSGFGTVPILRRSSVTAAENLPVAVHTRTSIGPFLHSAFRDCVSPASHWPLLSTPARPVLAWLPAERGQARGSRLFS